MKPLSIAAMLVALAALAIVAIGVVPASPLAPDQIATATVTNTSQPTPTHIPLPTSTPLPENAVRLRAATGQTQVQMFNSMSANADVMDTIGGGTVCIKLGGKIDTRVSGISMSFYRLDCNGQVGYVNAKWVLD